MSDERERGIAMAVQVLALLPPEDMAEAWEGFKESQLQRGIGEEEAAVTWKMLLQKVDEWRALMQSAGN